MYYNNAWGNDYHTNLENLYSMQKKLIKILHVSDISAVDFRIFMYKHEREHSADYNLYLNTLRTRQNVHRFADISKCISLNQNSCLWYRYHRRLFLRSQLKICHHWIICNIFYRKSGNNHSKLIIMTSSNGNIFCVTGPLCGEFTGPRWIPHTKASDAELWCFLRSAPE